MTERDTILTTGAAGRLGRLVVQMLHRKYRIIAVDRRPVRGLPKDVTHIRSDLRRRALDDVFRSQNIKAVVHLGLVHNPRANDDDYRFNVLGTQKLLDLTSKYEVDKFVMLSSANIYGPHPDNSLFLKEDDPLLGAQSFPGIRDLVAVDRIVQSFFYRQPNVETVMLRPVHIVGPRVKNAPSNYLRLERPWVISGFDPMVQLIHEEDVVRAMLLALNPGIKGVFNVVGPGEAPLSKVLKILERKTISVPGLIAWPMLERLFRFKMTSFPTPEIRHIQFNCIVDGALARNVMKFEPRYGLIETIRSVRGFED
ncbi:MAG: NAD-dependent epimerase/dehydratase family protein [Myxococcota bacterium]|nr:NAD-dependent epimerase/dehydratase family protein [Myxococcota bacterium]